MYGENSTFLRVPPHRGWEAVILPSCDPFDDLNHNFKILCFYSRLLCNYVYLYAKTYIYLSVFLSACILVRIFPLCIFNRVYPGVCVSRCVLFVSQCVCPTVSVSTSCIWPCVYPSVYLSHVSWCVCPPVCLSSPYICPKLVYVRPCIYPSMCMSHRVYVSWRVSHRVYISLLVYPSMPMCPHVPACVCSGVPPSACHHRAYVPPYVFRHGVYAPASQRMNAITTCMPPCVFIPQCVCPGVCMSHRMCLIVRMSIHTKYIPYGMSRRPRACMSPPSVVMPPPGAGRTVFLCVSPPCLYPNVSMSLCMYVPLCVCSFVSVPT